MGKYKRLERLIRINALIRANLMESRFDSDTTQKIISGKSDFTRPGGLIRRFAENGQKLAGNG